MTQSGPNGKGHRTANCGRMGFKIYHHTPLDALIRSVPSASVSEHSPIRLGPISLSLKLTGKQLGGVEVMVHGCLVVYLLRSGFCVVVGFFSGRFQQMAVVQNWESETQAWSPFTCAFKLFASLCTPCYNHRCTSYI